MNHDYKYSLLDTEYIYIYDEMLVMNMWQLQTTTINLNHQSPY